MTKTLFKAEKARVERAIQLIVNAFGEHGVTQLEGGIAMRALLDSLALQGLDIQSGAASDLEDEIPVEFVNSDPTKH